MSALIPETWSNALPKNVRPPPLWRGLLKHLGGAWVYLPLSSIFLVTASAFPTGVAAQEWVKVTEKSQIFSVGGQPVKLIIRPEIRFTDLPDKGILATVRAYARLDDLQNRSSEFLQVLAAQKSNCETRWSFPNLTNATAQDGKLKMAGQIRVVQWLCVGPLKTILASETADFAIGLYPSRTNEEVRIIAELERLDLGKTLLNDVADELRMIISTELDKTFSGDDAKFTFPPEVADLKPRFTASEIRDVGNGIGELMIEAEASIAASDMTKVLSLIAKQN